MTKAEVKHEIQRVEKAIRLIQRKFHTNYHFMVGVMLETDKEELGPESIMCVYKARGAQDVLSWNVDIDPEETSQLKWREIQNHLYHETAHVFLGPLVELLPNPRTEADKKRFVDVEENIAYQLGRLFELLLHGDIKERQGTNGSPDVLED